MKNGSVEVLIDGVKTLLTLVRYSARGWEYHTPGNASNHTFQEPLRAGQRFRTNGHAYEVLE